MPQGFLYRKGFKTRRDFYALEDFLPQGILCRRDFYALGDLIYWDGNGNL